MGSISVQQKVKIGASRDLSNLVNVNINLPTFPISKVVLKEDGTKESPSLSFLNALDSGFFLRPNKVISIVSAGFECLRAGNVPNAVNCLLVSPSPTGIGPTLAADGTDANIDLNLESKGTGKIKLLDDTIISGDLTVNGTTTTINSTTLTVEDKNIDLASVASPSDLTADGGGITLKGTTDKTILWKDATDSWDFNQAIRTGNLQLNGNEFSSITGDIDVVSGSGGVFKFGDRDFRAGQDANNYLEIGHGGSNSFVNQVGAGGMDFRFAGVTKATFTTAGHLHLMTDVDQKHTLKIITANNLNDTGMAFENSGGSFTHTIFRTDVGSNRADLVFAAGLNTNIDLLTNSFKIHGEVADEGKLEVLGVFQISSGSPALNKVLTSDAVGIATWETVIASGWIDDGTIVRLAIGSDSVGIGTSTPQAPLQVSGPGGVSVGGFPSGALHITSSQAGVNSNAVLTGHNLFGGNKQLWYLGSTSGSNDNIAFINRQTGSLSILTSGNGDILLTPNGTGNVVITSALSGLTQLTVDNIDINGNTISVTNLDGDLILDASTAGTGVVKVTDQLEIVGATSQLLLTDSDNNKTFIVKNNNGDFAITEIGGNNSFKILGGAAVNSIIITQNQVEIGTRLDVDNLRLDANTISSTDTNGNINVSPNGTGSFAVSTTAIIGSTSVNPDGALHVHVGSSGAVSASSVATALVVEDSTNNGISILTPAANSGRIVFGSPSDPFGAFLAWSDSVDDFVVGSSKIGANFRLTSGQETTNLTLSGGVGSELATFAKDVTISGQIKIAGGIPGAGKILTSDANGLADWLSPSLSGWTDFGADVSLTNINDKVGIGTTGPDTKLHVEDGTAGVVTAFAGTVATLESAGNAFLSLLSPDASVRGILFGEPSSNIAGGIFYNDSGSLDGFQFRVNGGVTKLTIESDGTVGINTANPDISAVLDVTSTTKGFLPPRMTTTERDAIGSPLPGLKIHNTTIDKAEVFIGTTWKTILTEDAAQVIVQETFASSNVRFFGELALPVTQGWTDTATGIATIDLVTQTVFGQVRQVVRHNDDTTGGSTTSKIVLTAQNWIDINLFGASYSGISRLDTVNGASGFFSGLQANAAENPLATGNRRYGILFDSASGNLRLIEADNTSNNVTMDGTNGNPLIAFDEWFSWECVVPTGLGAAEFYINGILTSFSPTFFVNGGGLGTQIIVSSGSTGGANRVAYHDNFGTTIFEESATRTLAAATMAGDVAQINIPEGKRDYTIVLPDGNPRAIGSTLRLVANNLLGSISLENQNPATPEILYNGLRTLVLEIVVKEVINGVNTVNSGNVYIGFKAEDVDRSSSIFAQLHSIIDQIPTDVNPTVITYTNHDAINGIGHSTTINTGELEILPGFGGTYFIMAQPQVGKDSGGVKVDFDMFLQVDRNGGFVDEPNSNIKLTIKDSDITDVIVSAITIQLQVGDKIRMMQAVSNAVVGMGLKNTDPVVGPPTVPRTPSIIFTMYRVGGL